MIKKINSIAELTIVPNWKKSRKILTITCKACGKTFDITQSEYNRIELKSGNHYFSRICYGKDKTQSMFNKIENGNTSFSSDTYKKYLILKHGNKCMKCGWHEINPITGLVPIQLEHKDGNSDNHNLNNLELLCPNCHSLTPTFGSLNKGMGREKRRLKWRERFHNTAGVA